MKDMELSSSESFNTCSSGSTGIINHDERNEEEQSPWQNQQQELQLPQLRQKQKFRIKQDYWQKNHKIHQQQEEDLSLISVGDIDTISSRLSLSKSSDDTNSIGGTSYNSANNSHENSKDLVMESIKMEHQSLLSPVDIEPIAHLCSTPFDETSPVFSNYSSDRSFSNSSIMRMRRKDKNQQEQKFIKQIGFSSPILGVNTPGTITGYNSNDGTSTNDRNSSMRVKYMHNEQQIQQAKAGISPTNSENISSMKTKHKREFQKQYSSSLSLMKVDTMKKGSVLTPRNFHEFDHSTKSYGGSTSSKLGTIKQITQGEELRPKALQDILDVESIQENVNPSNFDELLGSPLDIIRYKQDISPEKKSGASINSSRLSVSTDYMPIETKREEKLLFGKAKHYLLNTSWANGSFFRYVTRIYGDRKMITLFWMHCFCTLVIWAHFAFVKFDEKHKNVPLTAPNYWWKRIVPPLEFGTMHALLFQMALIPLTMARYSIAALSKTMLDRFIPFSRMVRIHIHLGYVFIITLWFSTLFFIFFFANLCVAGEDSFCAKFRSEIMSTGYGIIASLLIVGFTSYFRHEIPYEIFYAIHHLVFIMYAITVAHTLDDKERNGEQERSQTFTWFSATLLFYLCDRVAMYLIHRYKVKVLSSSVLEGGGTGCNTKMIILRVLRPASFRFQSGQYAYLKVDSVDKNWHPFSIASSPSSSYLQFYIEVHNGKSWTGKLWELFDKQADKKDCCSPVQMYIDIMGPYGSSLGNVEDYSHALAIGTGTGIVPILSLYKQHVRQLLRLDPELHLTELKEHQQKMLALEHAEEPRKGSLAFKLYKSLLLWSRSWSRSGSMSSSAAPTHTSISSSMSSSLSSRKIQWHQSLSSSVSSASNGPTIILNNNSQNDVFLSPPKLSYKQKVAERIRNTMKIHDELTFSAAHGQLSNNSERSRKILTRNNLQDLQHASFLAVRSIYGVVLLILLPVLGITLIALNISWNTIKVDLRYGMIECLQCLTITFQTFFAIVAIFIWDAQTFFAYTDLVICFICPFADWYWYIICESYGRLRSTDITLYSILIGYMTIRSWSNTVRPRHRSWKEAIENDGIIILERLEIVWSTRSSALVSEIIPDINNAWETLVNAWGKEHVKDVCRISVYVTDPDETSCEILKREIFDTQLYQDGCIHFGERMEIRKIIENHTLNIICDDNSGVRPNSQSKTPIKRSHSYSLLAFCGSSQLSELVQYYKISNDVITSITGNKRHQMEYRAECYGGVRRKPQNNDDTENNRGSTYDDEEKGSNNEEMHQGTKRKVTTFCKNKKYMV